MKYYLYKADGVCKEAIVVLNDNDKMVKNYVHNTKATIIWTKNIGWREGNMNNDFSGRQYKKITEKEMKCIMFMDSL